MLDFRGVNNLSITYRLKLFPDDELSVIHKINAIKKPPATTPHTMYNTN